MNNVISLPELFHQRVFRVPDYQRGYSWERLQITQFLEDLELLGQGRYHYTGTVVLHEPNSGMRRMDEDGNTYVPANIVDGQQRLTTIVLLLDGIRRSLAGLSKEAKVLANGIRKNHVAALDVAGQPLFKLSLNNDTDHFFKTDVLAEQPGVAGPENTSQRRLAEAKKQIGAYISGSTESAEDKGEEWLRSLYEKIATQLCFTLYEVGEEAEVGVIFEVMNDRGKPLTDLEKVKNYLLHASTALNVVNEPNELAKSVNNAWADILRRLMAANLTSSADEDRLLRAHWLTRYNPVAQQWQGSKSVKDKFGLREYQRRQSNLLDELHGYTQGLRESCPSFCDIYQPLRHDAFGSFKENPNARVQVIKWSEKLRRVGVLAPFLPLLLAMRERWPEDPDRYLQAVKLCEAYSFRVFRLKRSRSDAGQFTLFRLGYDLAHGLEGFEDAVVRFKRELAYRCGDDEFRSLISAEHQQVSDAYDWGGLRYFLYEYETALASNQGASPDVSWDDLVKSDRRESIEHILPQSIDNRPYWTERFDEQEHQRFVHDLGNLTLTKHNPHYGNKPFPEKKGAVDSPGHCYAKSPLYVERQLARWQNWDAVAVEERKSHLLDWAKNRWRVDLSGIHGEERDRDPESETDDIQN